MIREYLTVNQSALTINTMIHRNTRVRILTKVELLIIDSELLLIITVTVRQILFLLCVVPQIPIILSLNAFFYLSEINYPP